MEASNAVERAIRIAVTAAWPDRAVTRVPIASRILAPMAIGSRLPALVLLVLVIAAAALLVAGWGVPVGVGVFIGLALGFVAIRRHCLTSELCLTQ